MAPVRSIRSAFLSKRLLAQTNQSRGIPCVKSAKDFWAFSQAGRKLADLNLNYETVEPYPVAIETGGKTLTDSDYRAEKMRYGKKGSVKDLTTLHYSE